MKKWYKYLTSAFIAVILPAIPLFITAGNPLGVKTSAGTPPTVKWTVKNAFEQKVFIENKGQYDIPGKVNAGDIFYGATQGTLQYYFTANSIWIKKTVSVKRTKQEMELLEEKMHKKNDSKHEDDDDKENQYKFIDEFHEMTFNGASPASEITADSEVSWYYNFSINATIPVRAQAWKKITYRNLYPGIDMEFYFPEDKAGFKYVFIVHPGADASQIKIQYPLDKSVKLTSEGNISIQSTYGEFMDHSPLANQGAKYVSCRFTLDKSSLVQFNTGNYDKTQLLIIDPWTVTPNFTTGQAAFDLDWDDEGNVYVFGGWGPCQLIKFNNSGIQLWSYSFTYSDPANYISIGDFTVDKQSQSVYISAGYTQSTAAPVVKLNSSGKAVNMVYSPDFNEIWRIKYSSSANRLVMTGAGCGPPGPTGEISTMDTNLVSLDTTVDAFNLKASSTQAQNAVSFHDDWGLALDNFGNCYTANGLSTAYLFADGNVMIKCPLPSLSPTLWKTGEGYHFPETFNGYYGIYSPYLTQSAGFNGMICSCTNLFTYDSHVLKKWSLDSGELLSSIEVMDSSININYVGNIIYDYLWGGLTTDNYGNIFLGANDSIKQYNNNLQLVLNIGMPGPIFDVGLNLNDGKTLYVCGNGFLSAITVNPPIPNGNEKPQVSVVQPTSCVHPYGVATVDSPSVSLPADITWNTTPQQFGNTAINLKPGTYIVTINPGGCEDEILDTITIKNPGSEVFDTDIACQGHVMTLTGVPGENNYIWTPSTGLSSSNGSSVAATPSSNTMYTVTSTLNGCSDTVQFNFIVNPNPVVNVVPSSSSICDGQGDNTFTASGALSYQWIPSIALSETTGSVVTANPSVSTTYTVTGIDSTTGCSSTAIVTLFVGTQPTASFTMSSPITCEPQDIQFANNSTNGSAYLWNFGDDSTSTEMNPEHTYSKAGSYTITLVLTSVPGCTDSISATEPVQLGSDNIYIPSAFTPGHENNNYFSPNVMCSNASGYEFKVYNRWGELVYESTDPQQQGWDGRYNGANAPQDTYVYYIGLTCNGCKFFKKGDVTLLR